MADGNGLTDEDLDGISDRLFERLTGGGAPEPESGSEPAPEPEPEPEPDPESDVSKKKAEPAPKKEDSNPRSTHWSQRPLGDLLKPRAKK